MSLSQKCTKGTKSNSLMSPDHGLVGSGLKYHNLERQPRITVRPVPPITRIITQNEERDSLPGRTSTMAQRVRNQRPAAMPRIASHPARFTPSSQIVPAKRWRHLEISRRSRTKARASFSGPALRPGRRWRWRRGWRPSNPRRMTRGGPRFRECSFPER